jgi:hypothetical protein
VCEVYGEIGRTNEVSTHFIEQPENLQGTAEEVIGIHPLAFTEISLFPSDCLLFFQKVRQWGNVIRVVERVPVFRIMMVVIG